MPLCKAFVQFHKTSCVARRSLLLSSGCAISESQVQGKQKAALDQQHTMTAEWELTSARVQSH
jgi:hypothetical protein